MIKDLLYEKEVYEIIGADTQLFKSNWNESWVTNKFWKPREVGVEEVY